MLMRDIVEINNRPPVLMMEENRTADSAARAMAQNNCGAVVIMEGGHIAGIVTERDLVRKVMKDGVKPANIPLGQVMTRDVATASLDDELSEGLKKMADGKFRHLPVVDEDGHVITMINERDFIPTDANKTFHLIKEIMPRTFYERFQPWMILSAIIVYFAVTTVLVWMYFGM